MATQHTSFKKNGTPSSPCCCRCQRLQGHTSWFIHLCLVQDLALRPSSTYGLLGLRGLPLLRMTTPQGAMGLPVRGGRHPGKRWEGVGSAVPTLRVATSRKGRFWTLRMQYTPAPGRSSGTMASAELG